MIPGALRTRPLVFVDDLNRPVLDEADHHHLSRALRQRPGDPLTVGDGAGRWRQAVLGRAGLLDELGPVVDRSSDRLHSTVLTVGFALVKGDRSELAVQKLTELGVDRIVPLTTDRTVVRWDQHKAEKNHVRHRKVAREAAMQSRNLWLPDVWPVTEFASAMERLPGAALAEPGGVGLHEMTGRRPTTLLIGPEGGFSSQERQDRQLVELPGNILRTETAAICAGVLLVATAERG